MSDLIVCSLESWDAVWRRNQYLVAALLDQDPRLRVLFVEPPADTLFDLARRRRPTRARGLRRVEGLGDGRLWVYQQAKLAPRRAGAFVDSALSAGVRRVARRIGLHDPLLWINDPARAPLVPATGWPAIYDITDDWLLATRSPRELARLRNNEDMLMRQCRAVVVCSSGLAATKSGVRPVELITNGVDLARYTTALPRPHDLPPGPIALYVGTLHEDRLDVDLAVHTADVLGDVATLVFVGPNALDPRHTQVLASRSNVLLLGARPHTAVPAYLQHADVLVVPHVVDGFTDSLDPIKLYEYLAVGRPVVATPVAGFREAGGTVRTAPSGDFAWHVRELAITRAPSVAPPIGLPTWQRQAARFAEVLSAAVR